MLTLQNSSSSFTETSSHESSNTGLTHVKRVGKNDCLVYSYTGEPAQDNNGLPLPKTIGVLGYGAIGHAFVDLLLLHHPEAKIVALDKVAQPEEDTKRFKFLNVTVTRENVDKIPEIMGLQKGDILVDLSTNIFCLDMWPACMRRGIMYMNTAMEEWEDMGLANSYPESVKELYETSLGYLHDQAMKHPLWNENKGTTSIFEFGMNPGLISHCVKKGLLDAAAYFMSKASEWKDINAQKISEYVETRNFPKLAQELGLHTVHCSETDNQMVQPLPKDVQTKFYNTWSCRGFLTEGMVPIQVARGSHEDEDSDDFPRVNDGSIIMSWIPSHKIEAKSWLPDQEITGVLIPHGESYTINNFLKDPETGYSPSQYYVYDYNPLAKMFINNLREDITLQELDPEMEVVHPMNFRNIKGYDKVGALLVFRNNRAWWCGSIMDEHDSRVFFDGKYGPTVIQVAGGVYSAMSWALMNPNAGNKWADYLDTEFILERAMPYLGRFVSMFKDLEDTHLKDCVKFESFLSKESTMKNQAARKYSAEEVQIKQKNNVVMEEKIEVQQEC